MDKEKKNICDPDEINSLYTKKCSIDNKKQLEMESKNREELYNTDTDTNDFLYPSLDDPLFNIKIASKKEFSDTRYDGKIEDIETQAAFLKTAEYELSPYQAFVRNFLSFQTPYNSLLLFHGLGSGKTCSAIGVCEEMRDYLKQMGINKRIIIVASPNVQDNFKLQLFDDRKLKEVDGIWTVKGCLGNKLLKEINPTGMKGLTREKVIQQVKSLINSSYSFQGYVQFSNEIVRKSGKETDSKEIRIRNLENYFSNNLIVIDEVHNIRISDDNENKNVAKNLMFLVSAVSNIRLLLLSATPMFNSYKEIIWLLNLMNMNDRRGIISVSDIFDKDGNFKKDGKEMLIRKATGYISYVRGENPYTFPFRVYPDRFALENTFITNTEYPKYQLNGTKIVSKIEKLSLFLTNIGEYQELGYNYIISHLRNRGELIKMTKKGTKRKVAAFTALKSFGYTDLQIPIEALNIIYPYDGLEELVKNIEPFEHLEQEEKLTDEISPETDVVEEINTVIESGPKLSPITKYKTESESESEPVAELIEEEELIEEPKKEILSVKKVSPSEISFKGSLKKKEKDLEGGVRTTSSQEDILHIDPKDLTGIQGLRRVMDFVDTKTPGVKGQYEYRKGMPQVFSPNEIGKYSSKIKNICDYIYNKETGKVSDGIILIYSAYIDAGLIPMALALEEMGFTRYGEKAKPLFKKPPTEVVDVRTMQPPKTRKDFKPARYVMITGDSRLSPNNDADVKTITDNSNIFKKDSNGNLVDISGEIIKVVLISQAGSEGLDFKAIRQVHILEPWYNVNRLEQIIGRAVRNFSHKDLPFLKNNVQIFLYGTLLKNSEEESADLYIYRISELKAIKIGQVTRLLKQTAVDCFINHDQTNFVAEKFQEIEENRNIVQELSDHQILDNFVVGDIDDSATCDFMKCEFDCLPVLDKEDEIKSNDYTYNENFMLINSDKIIHKIKTLMKERHFYKRDELLRQLDVQKQYPREQINAALTQIINDNTEYIIDKYGRTGYLINIGDYYLFQPSELNYKNISIYDRSVPIDYKHDRINFEMKMNAVKPVIDKRGILFEEEDEEKEKEEKEMKEGRLILDMMYSNYNSALETNKVERGNNDWYQLCGLAMKQLAIDGDFISANSEKERYQILEQFLIEHIVDSLMMNEKIDLLNYIYSTKNLDLEIELKEAKYIDFYNNMIKYLTEKIIKTKGITGILIFDGPSRIDNLNIFTLDENKKWIPALPEDKRDLEKAILTKYRLKTNLNDFVGFIGFENNRKYMVNKIKDTNNKRSTGFRCDQVSQKEKIINILDEVLMDSEYTNIIKKDGKNMICVKLELILRAFQNQKIEEKTWFLDTETAIINEFEKKEKGSK